MCVVSQCSWAGLFRRDTINWKLLNDKWKINNDYNIIRFELKWIKTNINHGLAHYISYQFFNWSNTAPLLEAKSTVIKTNIFKLRYLITSLHVLLIAFRLFIFTCCCILISILTLTGFCILDVITQSNHFWSRGLITPYLRLVCTPVSLCHVSIFYLLGDGFNKRQSRWLNNCWII